MRKQFLTNILSFMFGALIISTIFTYALLTYMSKSNTKKEMEEKFEYVEEDIALNNVEIENLKQTLNAEYLAKTRAFAYMVKQNPEIIEDYNELVKIGKLLDVDELHVFDEKGIILWGTVKGYYGFDGNDSEQTKPFMEGITNKDFEFAQEPSANAVEGKLFQYIGVARMDQPGVIQIGMEPQRLETALENNRIVNVLSGYTIGGKGYIFAINKTNGLIEAFGSDSTYIGKTSTEIGLPDNFISQAQKNGMIKILGNQMYYGTHEYEDYLLCAVISQEELFQSRNSQMLIMLTSNFLIFFILTVLILGLLNRNVIVKMKGIEEKLALIKNGNLDIAVDEHINKEFSILSNGINEMVSSIKQKIEEAKQLAEETEGLMKNQNQVVAKVKVSAEEINIYAGQMSETADTLAQGAQQQAEELTGVSDNIHEMYDRIKESAKLAAKASEIAQNAGVQLVEGNEKTKEMLTAMETIQRVSGEIKNIIGSIDEIAEQSNLLALNASVESAKAGEQGKSFAIIASEIRDLAIKSMEAAADTKRLIKHTLDAIEVGIQSVNETLSTLDEVGNGAKEATKMMVDVAESTEKQEQFIGDITKRVEQISTILEETTATADSSAHASSNLAKESEILQEIVRNV